MDLGDLHHPATYIICVIALIFGIVKISLWAGGINELKRNIYPFMEEIREDIKKILSQMGPTTQSVYEAKSPLQLTELGKTISTEVNAAEWAQQTAPQLIDAVRGSARI